VSLNWKEIDLILSELELPGAQIQKVWQAAFDVLALHVYGGSQSPGSRLILVSLSPLACRIHETFRAVPKSEKPLRFAEFCKSRIVNGRIEEALQLGDNRIVRITVRRGETLYRVYIRLWSNAANVIVTDEQGVILDAMKRLPKRGEVTGGMYRPEDAPPEKAALQTKAAAVSKNYETRTFEIRNLPGEGSFNSKVDAWYAEHGGKLSLEQLREELSRTIGKNRNRLEAALERLREKEADYEKGDRFKEYGDLILSNTASVQSEGGAAWLSAQSFTGDGGDIRIELDPRKSPAKNAEAYYEKYRKAKSGLGSVRDEITAGEDELTRLSETEKRLLEETNPLRLEALLRKLRQKGACGARHTEGARHRRPGIGFADGDWLILVGRDAAENDQLLRHHVKGNDLWLHARDWAGGYVFIKNRPGKSVPLDVLLDAGNLALFYSKGRNNKKGDLYYTQVKFLRRAKNGPKGLVIPTQEKNLHVVMEDSRLKKLEDLRI